MADNTYIDGDLQTVNNTKILQTKIDTVNRLEKLYADNSASFNVGSGGESVKKPASPIPSNMSMEEALSSPNYTIRKYANELFKNNLAVTSPAYALGAGETLQAPLEDAKKYIDKNLGYDVRSDNEDLYHQQYEADFDAHPIAGSAKNIGKALGRFGESTIMKTIEGLGYVGALVTSIGSSNYWADVADNSLSKIMEKWEQDMKDSGVLAVYHSADYDNKGFFAKMLDATFWTDEGADAAAFMASAMIPGFAASKLGLIADAGTLFGKANALARAANTAGKLLTGSKNWGEAANWAFSVASESAFETSEFYHKQVKDYQDRRANGEEGYRDMTDQQIKSIVGKKAADIFKSNFLVLSASNAWENRMLFGALGKTRRNATFGAGADVVASRVGLAEEGLALEMNRKKLKGLSKIFDFSEDGRLGFYGKKAVEGYVAEGLWEENAQLAIQRMNSNDHLYYDIDKGNTITNFLEQIANQAWKGSVLGGETDKEASTSIGLGALMGAGVGVLLSKTFGGSDVEGRKKLFKGERRSIIENTEARIAKANEALSRFTDMTDIHNPDGTINPAKFDLKKAGLSSLVNRQIKIEDVKDPAFKDFLTKNLFKEYALATLQTGKFDEVIQRLQEIGLKSPEDIRKLGFDPAVIQGDHSEIVSFGKELQKTWNVIKDLDINPTFAKLKGYTTEELTSINEDRKRLAFSFAAQGLASKKLIESRIALAGKLGNDFVGSITGSTEEVGLFANDILNHNAIEGQIRSLEQVLDSTKEKTDATGKKSIANPQPKFYITELEKQIANKKVILQKNKKAIEEKEKLLGIGIKETNGLFVFSDKDVQNVADNYAFAKVKEFEHINNRDYTEFMSSAFLDKEKGLANYKDFMSNINPIMEKLVTDTTAQILKQFADLGYTEADVKKMTQKEKDDILKNKTKKPSPTPPTGNPPAQKAPLYTKEGLNQKHNIGLTAQLWIPNDSTNAAKETLVKTLNNKTVNDSLKHRFVSNTGSQERVRNYFNEAEGLMTVFVPSPTALEFYIEVNGVETVLGRMSDPNTIQHYQKNASGEWVPIAIKDLTPEQFSKMYTVGAETTNPIILNDRLIAHRALLNDLDFAKKQLTVPAAVTNKIVNIILSRGEFSFAPIGAPSIAIGELEDFLTDEGNYTVLGIIDRTAFDKGDIAFNPLIGTEPTDVQIMNALKSKELSDAIHAPNMNRYSLFLQTPNGYRFISITQSQMEDVQLNALLTSLKSQAAKSISENLLRKDIPSTIDKVNAVNSNVKTTVPQKEVEIRKLIADALEIIKTHDAPAIDALNIEGKIVRPNRGAAITQITKAYFKDKKSNTDSPLVQAVENLIEERFVREEEISPKENTFNDKYNKEIDAKIFIASSKLEASGKRIPYGKFELSLGINPFGKVRLTIEDVTKSKSNKTSNEKEISQDNFYIESSELDTITTFKEFTDLLNTKIKAGKKIANDIVIEPSSFKNTISRFATKAEIRNLKTSLSAEVFKNPTIKVKPLQKAAASPQKAAGVTPSPAAPTPSSKPKSGESTTEVFETGVEISVDAIHAFRKARKAGAEQIVPQPPASGGLAAMNPNTPISTGFTDGSELFKVVFNNDGYTSQNIQETNAFTDFMKEVLPVGIFSYSEMDSIGQRMANNGVVVGRFISTLQTLEDGSKEVKGIINTTNGAFKYHEAFHGIYRLLLTNEEQSSLRTKALAEIYQELHDKGTSLNTELKEFAKQHPNYEKLTSTELKDLYVEEWMADKYEEYKQNNKPKSWLVKLFDRISTLIKNLLGKETLSDFFEEIERGVYKNRVVQMNTFTSKLYEDGYGEQEANKIKIIVIDNAGQQRFSYLPDSEQQTILATLFNNFVEETGKRAYNKNSLLDELMDDLKFSLNPEDVEHTNIFSALHFNDSREAIKKEIDKILTYIGYTSSLESEEYETKVDDEGDRPTTDNYSSSENFGGFKSLSREVREYLLTVSDTSKIGDVEQTVAGRVIYKQIFVPFVYNGILKAVAGYTTTQEFLDKLKYFSEYNINTRVFARKFFSDVFGEPIDNLDAFIPNVHNVKNSTLFNLFKTNFETVVNPYIINAFQRADNKAIFINANAKNSAKLQFQAFANDFVRNKSEDTSTKAFIINGLALKIREYTDGTYDPKLTPKELSVKLSDSIQLATGLKFQPSLIELTLLREIPYGLLTPEQTKMIDLFPEVESIKPEDLFEIANSINRGENPFLSFYTVSETETERVDLTETGAATRLMNIAISNAVFNEYVWDTVFVNADGERVWTHQAPTYNSTKIAQIKKKEAVPEDSLLYNRDDFQSVLPHISLFRNGGNKIVVLDAKGNINDSLEVNQTGGKTFGKFKTRDLYFNLLSSFLNYRTINGITVTPHLTRVLEASNTGDMIELPLLNVLDNNEDLTEEAIDILNTQFEKEAQRILDVTYEILTDNNRTIIEGYNNDLVEGDLRSEDDVTKKRNRGTRFFNFAEILGAEKAADIEEMIKKEVISAVNNGEEKPLLGAILYHQMIETDFNEFFKNHIDTTIQDMIDEEVISRDDDSNLLKNKSLPAEFFNGGTKEQMSDLRLVKNNPTLNIGRMIVNDFINTMLYNDMIFRNESELFKDPVDMIKRAKGINAGGPSIYTEVTDESLGIYHDTTKIDILVKPSVKYYGKYKKDEQDRMDAQSVISEKMFRHIMFALGRLDKNTANIYDRIINGEETIDDIFGKNGLISFNRQTSVLKLVYFDGENYIKTSSLVLTKKFTSKQDDRGNWIPLPHRRDLHQMRTELEELERNNSSDPKKGKLVWLVTSSASKMRTVLAKNGAFHELKGNDEYTQKDVSTKFLRLQVENPSNKKDMNDPTQAMHIVDTEIDENFIIQTLESSLGDIRRQYQELQKQKSKVGYINNRNILFNAQLRNELNTAINLKTVSPNLETFRKNAVETLKKTGASSSLIDFFELGYNLNSPVVREKFEDMLSAMISKNGFKSRVNGASFTLATDYGVNLIKRARVTTHEGKRIVEWNVIQSHLTPDVAAGVKEYKTPSLSEARTEEAMVIHRQTFLDSLQDGELFIDELQHNVPVYDKDFNIISHYSEIVVPPHQREVAEMIENGQEIPNIYMEGLGTRIPSQDRHSSVTVRVVDFAPSHLGSVVFSPKEVIEISGADFDVDKLYTKMQDIYFTKGENGWTINRYGDNPILDEFTEWNLKNNSNLRDRINVLKNESAALREVQRKLDAVGTDKKILIPTIKEKLKKLYALEKKKTKELDELYTKVDSFRTEADLIAEIEQINNVIEGGQLKGKALRRAINKHDELTQLLEINQEESENPNSAISKIRNTQKYLKGLRTQIENKQTEKEGVYVTRDELLAEKALIIALIEDQAMHDIHLPILQSEYTKLVEEHGIQNIGQLNNDILRKQILLQSNEWVVSNNIDSETASLEMFTKFRKDLDLIPGLNQQPALNPNSLLGKIKHQKSNKEGAIGIGPAVNAMLMYTLFHKYGVKLVEPIVVDGKKYQGYDRTTTDNAGNTRIFNIISQIVTAMTDNAKERIAYEFNLPISAVSTFVHMVSLGIDEKTVQAMFLTPPVKDYIRQVEKAKLNGNNPPIKIIRESFLRGYDASEAENVPINTSRIINLINSPKSDADFIPYFMKFFFDRENEMSDISFDLMKILKLTQGLVNGLDTIENVQKALVALEYKEDNNPLHEIDKEEKESKWEGIPEAIRRHFVSQYVAQIDEFSELMKTMSIRATNVYQAINKGMHNQTHVRRVDEETFNRDLLNTMLSFFQIKAYKNLSSSSALSKFLDINLLIGEENITTYIERAKSVYVQKFGEKSDLLEKYISLVPTTVLQNGIQVSNPLNKAGFNLASLNTWTNFDDTELSKLKNEFQNLLLSNDPILRDAGLAMYAYTIVKDGHMFKSKGLLSIIPVEYMKKFVDTLDELQNVFLDIDKVKSIKEIDEKHSETFEKTYGASFSSLIDEFFDTYLQDKTNSFRIKLIQNITDDTVSTPIPREEGQPEKYKINILKNLKLDDKEIEELSVQDYNDLSRFLGGSFYLKKGEEFKEGIKENVKAIKKMGLKIVNNNGKINIIFPKVIKVGHEGEAGGKFYEYYKLVELNGEDDLKSKYTNSFILAGSNAVYELFTPKGNGFAASTHSLFGTIPVIKTERNVGNPDDIDMFYSQANIDDPYYGLSEDEMLEDYSQTTGQPVGQQPQQPIQKRANPNVLEISLKDVLASKAKRDAQKKLDELKKDSLQPKLDELKAKGYEIIAQTDGLFDIVHNQEGVIGEMYATREEAIKDIEALIAQEEADGISFEDKLVAVKEQLDHPDFYTKENFEKFLKNFDKAGIFDITNVKEDADYKTGKKIVTFEDLTEALYKNVELMDKSGELDIINDFDTWASDEEIDQEEDKRNEQDNKFSLTDDDVDVELSQLSEGLRTIIKEYWSDSDYTRVIDEDLVKIYESSPMSIAEKEELGKFLEEEGILKYNDKNQLSLFPDKRIDDIKDKC